MQSSGSIGLCLVWQTRPLCIASYAISVRQTGSLPVSALHCLHIRLPSDSTSRWTPLPSANSSYCQVCSGLSPPSYCPCRAHEKRPEASRWLPAFSLSKKGRAGTCRGRAAGKTRLTVWAPPDPPPRRTPPAQPLPRGRARGNGAARPLRLPARTPRQPRPPARRRPQATSHGARR